MNRNGHSVILSELENGIGLPGQDSALGRDCLGQRLWQIAPTKTQYPWVTIDWPELCDGYNWTRPDKLGSHHKTAIYLQRAQELGKVTLRMWLALNEKDADELM